MDEAQAEQVVDALRERGIFAHVARPEGPEEFHPGVRVVLPDGREALWSVDGAAGLEAEVVQDGDLVGYVPLIPGSADFGTEQIVQAIAGADYSRDGRAPGRD